MFTGSSGAPYPEMWEEGRALEANTGTTANRSQNRTLIPHSPCCIQLLRAGEKQHLSSTPVIMYFSSHEEQK